MSTRSLFRVCTITYFLGFSLYAAIVVTMFLIGEIGNLEGIVKRQLRQPDAQCKYQSAFRYDDFAYKQILFQQRPSEIALFGSSRGMQVRDSFFSSSFINLSGGIGGVPGMMQAVDFTLRENEGSYPNVVILMIDYWWFRAELGHNDFVQYDMQFHEQYIFPNSNIIANFINYIRSGRVDAGRLLAHLSDCNVGLSAIVNGDGFRRDGSMDYYSYITGQRPSPDYQFEDVKRRISSGVSQFQYSSIVNVDYISDITSLIDRLIDNNIEVVAVLAPLPQSIYELMLSSGNYDYIPEMRKKLRQNLGATGAQYYDFLEAGNLDSGPCEFIDGFHGGEITYARIFEFIRKDSGAGYINNLSSLISQHKDHPSSEYSQNNHLGFTCAENG
jgi:hypothetical protein